MNIEKNDKIEFDYKNYKGVQGTRRVLVHDFMYGNTEFHPETQMLMSGIDLDKNEFRVFAVGDMSNVHAYSEKQTFDEWVAERERIMFRTDKFTQMGREEDYIFQALVFLGEGSHSLSLATTIMSDLDYVPERLKIELKSIQSQLHVFQDMLRCE